MCALSTLQTAVFDIPHFLRVPTPEHLGHEAIIVGLIVARIDACEPVPVLGKDLFKDVPILSGFCDHQAAPSEGVRIVAVQRFYHVTPAQSTPSSAFTGACSSISLTLKPRGLQGNREMKIPIRSRY